MTQTWWTVARFAFPMLGFMTGNLVRAKYDASRQPPPAPSVPIHRCEGLPSSCPASRPGQLLADAGSPLRMWMGMKRDPLRLCWYTVNQLTTEETSPECIEDAALHKIEAGMPPNDAPIIAIAKNHMLLVDGGPVMLIGGGLMGPDQDGPRRWCPVAEDQVFHTKQILPCWTRAEILGNFERDELDKQGLKLDHGLKFPDRPPMSLNGGHL